MSRRMPHLASAAFTAGALALAACHDEPTLTRPLTPDSGAPRRAISVPSTPQRVKWRLKLAGDYSLHAPGVGADGTVYVVMSNGKLDAVAPNGTLKWVFSGADWQVSVGPDGTIYTNADVVAPSGTGAVGAVNAITPTGALKWRFNQTGDFIMAGPNVGPDGNVYAVTDFTGIGLFSLTPNGQLRFKTGRFTEYGFLGEQIAFGSGQLYFSFDMAGTGTPPSLFAYGLNGSFKWRVNNAANNSRPAVGPNGNISIESFPTNVGLSVATYTPAGGLAWSFYEFPGNTEEHPDVGPDNTVYTVRNLGTLLALNPNGTVKWRVRDTTIMFEPRIRPQNDLLFMGGRITYGAPGYFQAVSAAGTPLWRVNLPDEPGFAPYGQLVPMSRPVFSPDGNTAYVVTDVAGDGSVPYQNLYAFLYAIDVSSGSPPPPPSTNQPPVARFTWTCTAAGLYPHQCAFDASTSSDDHGIVSYAWTWGNGTGETKTVSTTKKTYATAGTYTVTLKVSDGGGLTSTTSQTITVP